MSITTDDVIIKYGTLDDLDNSSAPVADGDYSVSGDLVSWTNDDDAAEAVVALTWQYASGTLSANAVVEIHYRRINYIGTDDEATPSAGYAGGYAGTASVDTALAVSTDSRSLVRIPLSAMKSAQEYEFYIANNTGVTISAGWKLEITPNTVGPHA